ncbi:MAG: YqgE/AlgH family protein [Alphaproteobacteria bacterium]|nr:YqgE/AlgH family protein [Alphaproteobacteria bacterium]MBP7757730.1 YqgE/AlgH family protein [Alphaproteobacteria bacterium]MBP7761070.1 YqgE/AlgH family protein [Alphaproteobacteria bacterium]MBP7904556.1 YqgE/AlgH family protein [Alphaproteobacteria bacterium]
MPLRLTPHAARWYLLGAALLLAFPSLMSLYTRYDNKLVVALGKVDRDPNFAQTVVYIAAHNGWGAQGLILNKPLPEQERHKLENIPSGFDWYVGGPVMYPWGQFVLVTEGEAGRARWRMLSLPDYTRKYPVEWKKILEDGEKKKKFRIYLGFSGWGSAQLEREIIRAGWGIIDFQEDMLTQTMAPEDIWRNAMKKVLEKSPEKQKGI